MHSKGEALFSIGPLPLSATACRLTHLLAPFDGRLHVVTAALELPKNALRSHLSL